MSTSCNCSAALEEAVPLSPRCVTAGDPCLLLIVVVSFGVAFKFVEKTKQCEFDIRFLIMAGLLCDC